MEPIASFAGLFPVLVTPFTPTGAVDDVSLDRLIEHFIEQRACGLVAASVMGEAARLDERERRHVVTRVLARAGGRVPVVAAILERDIDRASAAARRAEDMGAAAVLVAPPGPADALAGVASHFQAVAAASRLPIVILDAPSITGVSMSVEFLARLSAEIASVRAVKLEDSPTPTKIEGLRAATSGRMRIFGGLGGLHCFHELERGADGLMTGYAYPEHLVAILDAVRDRRIEDAAAYYARWLPLIAYEAQPAIGVALRKEILHRRGLIACATVRPPTPALEDGTRAQLGRVLARVGASGMRSQAGIRRVG